MRHGEKTDRLIENAQAETKEATRLNAGKKIRCTRCGDVIQSLYRWDFKPCGCGRIAIDGGGDYTRILFKERSDFEFVEELEADGNGDVSG